MNNNAEKSRNHDEVDQIVDALVADPSCASDVKMLLRRKIAAPDIVHMIAPRPAGVKAAITEGEAEDDMWDNMPV